MALSASPEVEARRKRMYCLLAGIPVFVTSRGAFGNEVVRQALIAKGAESEEKCAAAEAVYAMTEPNELLVVLGERLMLLLLG